MAGALAATSQLRFERRGGVTALVACRSEPPLLFQRPLRGPAGEAVMVMLSPAAALFEADTVHLAVECGPDTDVTLVTTAATKLNRCAAGAIGVAVRADVGERARFHYLPYELIPFRGAVYRQRLEVRLAAASHAALLEVVSPGRSDEPFAYTRLDFETEVRHLGVTVVRERFALTPAARGALHGYTHYASLLALGPGIGQPEAELAHRTLAGSGVHGSASSLPAHGIALKALGHAALPLREALLRGGPTPAWLRHVWPP